MALGYLLMLVFVRRCFMNCSRLSGNTKNDKQILTLQALVLNIMWTKNRNKFLHIIQVPSDNMPTILDCCEAFRNALYFYLDALSDNLKKVGFFCFGRYLSTTSEVFFTIFSMYPLIYYTAGHESPLIFLLASLSLQQHSVNRSPQISLVYATALVKLPQKILNINFLQSYLYSENPRKQQKLSDGELWFYENRTQLMQVSFCRQLMQLFSARNNEIRNVKFFIKNFYFSIRNIHSQVRNKPTIFEKLFPTSYQGNVACAKMEDIPGRPDA